MFGFCLAEKIGSKAFEIAVDRVVGALAKELEPEIRSMERRLTGIDAKLDRLLAVPLKAGFFSLRAGDLLGAQRQLAEAEAADEYGAVAKFWLSLVLFQQGKSDLAIEKMRDALLINPFVAPTSSVGQKLFSVIAGLKTVSTSSAEWIQQLNEKKFLRSVPKNMLRTLWPPDSGPRNKAAVCAASCSGDQAVIMWKRGSDLLSDFDIILSAFHLPSGRCVWSRRLKKNSQLRFASSRYVVLEFTAPPGGYELLSLRTGQPVTKLTTPYFQIAFCPENSQLRSLHSFNRSNCYMIEAKESWERCCTQPKRSRIVQLIKTGSWHEHTEFTEERCLEGPFGWGTFRFRVINKWQHFLYTRGMYPSPPFCGLACESLIGFETGIQKAGRR